MIAAILSAVHLLAYHIGALTDSTPKQIRFLKQRGTSLAKPRMLDVLVRHGLNRLPALKHLRQQILNALEALELAHVRDTSSPYQFAS